MKTELQPTYERQKTRIIMCNDSLWNALLELKGERLSISEYLRNLIEEEFERAFQEKLENG